MLTCFSCLLNFCQPLLLSEYSIGFLLLLVYTQFQFYSHPHFLMKILFSFLLTSLMSLVFWGLLLLKQFHLRRHPWGLFFLCSSASVTLYKSPFHLIFSFYLNFLPEPIMETLSSLQCLFLPQEERKYLPLWIWIGSAKTKKYKLQAIQAINAGEL